MEWCGTLEKVLNHLPSPEWSHLRVIEKLECEECNCITVHVPYAAVVFECLCCFLTLQTQIDSTWVVFFLQIKDLTATTGVAHYNQNQTGYLCI